MKNRDLYKEALEAQKKSMAKYSNFHVGAALLTDDEKVYHGANIESSSYSLTICAERSALFSALVNGERKFKKIALATDSDDFCTPCGACRQVMRDHCSKDLEIIVSNGKGELKTMTLDELLPHSFTDDMLI